MNGEVKIICAGDYAPRENLTERIELGQFDEMFYEVRTLVSSSDYSIVNLESPVVENVSAKPIEKIGPNLKCTIKSVDALVYMGFSMVTLANNHFYDFGDVGVYETLKACKGKLDVVGGGMCIQEAILPFRKVINGTSFTFINCCEQEYSIATNKSGGSNPLNPFFVFKQIQEAKKKRDKIIVIIHGGREYFQYPTLRMKETYRFFVDAGADVVINHHQHCYCGFEQYHKGLIFYGLGNFCFNKKQHINDLWNYGYLVELIFEDEFISCKIHPYKQCADKLGIFFLKDSELKSFNSNITELSSVIQNDELLVSKLNDFNIQQNKDPLVIFEPYTNRVLSALRRRRLIPSFVSKNKKVQIYAKLLCESHRDCIMAALNQQSKK